MKKSENVETIADDRTQIYEVGYHIIPIVSEADLGARVTAVRDVIESNGGNVISDEYPRHMDLAYDMAKVAANKRSIYPSAYFGWMKFESSPAGAKLIDVALHANNEILRYLLVKTVRENTMVPKKVLRAPRREDGDRPEEKAVVLPVMTEEEMDKTIEDLVIS